MGRTCAASFLALEQIATGPFSQVRLGIGKPPVFARWDERRPVAGGREPLATRYHRSGTHMTTWTRYWLFQIPGWALTVVVLLALRPWIDISLSVVFGLLALIVIKDFLLYPFVRSAYDTRVKTGIAQLIGSPGVVKQDLDPEGFVLVRGELWKARLTHNHRAAPKGTEVQIEAADGMTLLVEPIGPA